MNFIFLLLFHIGTEDTWALCREAELCGKKIHESVLGKSRDLKSCGPRVGMVQLRELAGISQPSSPYKGICSCSQNQVAVEKYEFTKIYNFSQPVVKRGYGLFWVNFLGFHVDP